jgi:pimeloyl-ACP methyl ester carboxylesterase
MAAWKNVRNKPTLFLFGTDWRRSIADNVSEPDRYLRCVEEVHGDRRALFIGHSQGGVIIEAFARRFPGRVHATVAVAARSKQVVRRAR